MYWERLIIASCWGWGSTLTGASGQSSPSMDTLPQWWINTRRSPISPRSHSLVCRRSNEFDDAVRREGADEATVYFYTLISYWRQDPKEAVIPDTVTVSKDFVEIREAYIADYQEYAGGTSLNLGVDEAYYGQRV